MALIVKKFGGSSVADVSCMQRVASRVSETVSQGHDVVVVVSAMGKTTDNLVALAREVNGDPDDREYDMLLASGEQISVSVLAMALHAKEVAAVSLTGPQAGIRTDDAHTRARITDIDPEPIQSHLAEGKVVIVAGFQGLSPKQNIATLGRGGSDLSAVALAGALKAERCQIYTDVEGVFTADPRVVPTARKMNEISYDEMLELASLGAKVLQARSVEFAKKYGVKIEVLSSFTHAPGTLVQEEVEDMEGTVLRGIACDKSQSKITVKGVRDEPGIAARLFKELAAAEVNVDMIVQNTGANQTTDISFTVPTESFSRTHKVVLEVAQQLGEGELVVEEEMAKVSVVGVGMRTQPGVAHTTFATLADAGINIDMISSSDIRISVVIGRSFADRAVSLLHEAFGLGV